MYDHLRPGGRLIVTVPVDRRYRVERRERAEYGFGQPDETGQVFFQHVYDEDALEAHLLSALPIRPARIGWFGELTPGRFAAYERRWQHDGLNCTVDDPREFSDHYREFDSWQAMPGFGVCGLMWEKPA